MTNREMTELFSVMLLAWPNAELFRGGIGKIGPTIMLWARSAADVDYWTGQQAVYRLIKTNKFPPSVSEFLEQAEAVKKRVADVTEQTFREIRSADYLYPSLEAFYLSLPRGSFTAAVIDAAGGVERLTARTSTGQSMWNLRGIEAACRQVIRKRAALDGQHRELPAKRGTQ